MTFDALEVLRKDADAFISAVMNALDTPIPFCGDWNGRDLAHHHGFIWAFANVNAQGTTEYSKPGPEGKAPEGDDDLGQWLQERADALLTTLSDSDPATPTWAFVPNDHTVGFWRRRMMHETSVHRWDAQWAAGATEPIEPAVASDGIDEYTQVGLQFSGSKPNRIYPEESLHVHCTDVDGEWMLIGGGENTVTVTREHAKGDAAVKGPAEHLLLWIWGRPGGDIEIFGDETVASTWRNLAP